MMSLREWWSHTFYDREQSRAKNFYRQRVNLARHSGLMSLEAAVTTRPPLYDPAWKWGIDIAGIWDGVIDAVRFYGFGGSFVVVKAADGTLTATRVYENIDALQEANTSLGTDIGLALYFWLYPNNCVNCVNQGRKWASLAKLFGIRIGAIDYEWTSFNGQPANPNAGDLALALDAYEQALGERAWIYTSLGYVGDHPLGDRFKTNPFWAAQYGVLAPSSVLPWGHNWTMWQQSDRWAPAADWGIDPNYAHVSDGDVMTPATFYSIFTGADPEPPPADVITSPWPGVVVTEGRRFGSDFRMAAVSPEAVADEWITTPGRGHIAEEIPGDIVTNGGDFDMTTYEAVGLLRSHGYEYAPQADSEPAIGFDASHRASLDHHTQAGWIDAVGLKRYLVIDGARSPNTSVSRSVSENREVSWDAREPRTIFGLRRDGTRLILSVKGRTPDQAGITLYQAADIMIEFGADRAGDGDGGDSVQSRVGDALFLGTSQRRLVADFYTITIKSGAPMPTYRYTALSSVSRSYRNGNNVLAASIGTIPANVTVEGEELFVADHDVYSNGVKVQAVGDQWLHILLIGSAAAPAGVWTAITHLGRVQMALTDNGAPPPTDDDFFTVNLDVVHVVGGQPVARYAGVATLPKVN